MSKTSIYLICLFGLLSFALSKSIFDSSSESSESSGDGVEQWLGELQSMCLNKTGSNETMTMIIAQVGMLPFCMNFQVDLEALSKDVDTLTADLAVRKPFFEKYCPQVQSALGCLDPVVHELRKCMDPEEAELVDILINMIPEGLNLICKNDGAILFSEEGFSKCEDKAMEYIGECLELISNTTEALDISDYDKKECDDLAATRGCLATKLNECEGSSWMDIIDLFYKPIIKASPCKKFIILEETNLIETNMV
ncbi:27 kDa hemolymph glycoprotein-like [Uranotaenia lowii]|uniref:27 kDa hemolymph glycoprotein-like n=1 Tax=Uranotaenia lowii TaxID=190385 RepID=UPI0024783BC7|nr:27 kDa hemolymph glycoprotein-like [Uranotaenia lowii]